MRVPLNATLVSPVNGSALVGVEVTITKHVPGGALGSGEAASIYTSETEGSKVSGNTIVTDARGTLTQGEASGWAAYWLPVGQYDLYWHGGGTKSFYAVRELISAGAEAIDSEQLAEGSVTEAKLAAGSVSEGKIAESAVGTSRLKALAVTASKIAAEAVEAAKIKTESVGTAALANLAVTEGKLANDAVTADKLGAGTIVVSGSYKLELKVALWQPQMGSNVPLFGALVTGITFPTRCVYAWVGGFVVYDSTNKTPVSVGSINVLAGPEGTGVKGEFQNGNGAYYYLRAQIFALGY